MVKIEYDMENEMKIIEKKVSKLIERFSDVEDLENVLKQTLELYYSETFRFYTKNVEKLYKTPTEGDDYKLYINSLKKDFPLVENAMILKYTKIKLIYVPGLWSDVIVFENFDTIFSFCFNILEMKKKGSTAKEGFYLTEKLMSLVYDFDKFKDFNPITKKYFEDLKKIKWNKRANKLFDKIYSIHGNILYYIFPGLFSKLYNHNYCANRFILTMLAACNAINNNRNIIFTEDVIIAYKTFHKLFDAKIEDLI